VLLSIRAATADDSSPLPVEFLYGSQLVLPGQLVVASDPPPVSSFVESLRRLMDSRSPPPTCHNSASTAAQSAPLPPNLLHARRSPPPMPAPMKCCPAPPDIVATSRLKAAQLPLDAAPAAPWVTPSSPPSRRVRFSVPDAPVPPPPPCVPGHTTRLRRPPERFSLSAVGCKTGGRCSKPLSNVVFSQYFSIL
jgi:hypothetical protein